MYRSCDGSLFPEMGAALVIQADGRLGLENRTATAPATGEVRIAPVFVGVCGTDLEIIDGAMDPAYVKYPLVLGHEWSGVVVEIGLGVTRVRVGDHVVVEGILPDGVCAACRAGDTNLCEVYDELGFTRDGAASPSVTAPEQFVHRLSGRATLEAGALVEPLSVVLRGLHELPPERGDRVLVIGDGTVGLLAAHAVGLFSPAQVVLAGRRDAQRALAESVGVDVFTTELPEERSFDYVIEAAGATEAVQSAFKAPRRGGKLLLLGIAGHGQAVSVSSDDIVNNDLVIRGSFGYTAEAWRTVVALLASGDLDPAPLITHRFEIDDFEKAVATLRGEGVADDEPRGKVLLVPTRR